MGARVLLVGAGQGHLETISRAEELIRAGASVALIAPEPFRYTGTATGELGGRYELGFGCVDVAAIARARGIDVCTERASRLETSMRRVHVQSGGWIEYDWLSVDLGSAPNAAPVHGLDPARVARVKPVTQLLALRDRLRASSRPPLVVVLGGGASGCEVAANIKACAPSAVVTIVTRAPRVMDGGRAAKLLEPALLQRGIALVLGRKVVRARDDSLELDDASSLRFDILVDASGPRPHELNESSGLLLDERGAIVVDATLRSESDSRVFVVGDGAARRGTWPTKNGVHAVREGHALVENLSRVLRGAAPLPVVWPTRTLQILDLGDGTALACWGDHAWRSRVMLWWKERIDRRWLERWKRLERARSAHFDARRAP